jgi:hypothetical protein
MKPTEDTETAPMSVPSSSDYPPKCWVLFFREARRIAARRRLCDARSGVRHPRTLERIPSSRNTGTKSVE